MAARKLPRPVVRDDSYLAAILEELEGQRKQVAALEWGVTAIVRLLAARLGPVEVEV